MNILIKEVQINRLMFLFYLNVCRNKCMHDPQALTSDPYKEKAPPYRAYNTRAKPHRLSLDLGGRTQRIGCIARIQF